MIKIFQNRHLGILQDVPQIDAFRIPELSKFTEVEVTLKTNCEQLSARLSSKTFSPSSAGYSRGKEAEKLSAEIWNSTPGLVS